MKKGLKKLVTSANTEPEINMSANSYDIFLDTLTEEQRTTDLYKLNDDLIYKHIQALYIFLLEAIPDSNECANKCAIMFACRLAKKDIQNFDFNLNFDGTKLNVEKENISFNIQKIEAKNIIKSEEVIEYGDDNTSVKEPRRKIGLLLNDKAAVLEMFNMIKYGVQEDKGLNTAQSTAALLVVLDNMSAMNAQDLNLTMQNLIINDKETNQSFMLKVKRIEQDFENIVDYKKSLFGFGKRKG